MPRLRSVVQWANAMGGPQNREEAQKNTQKTKGPQTVEVKKNESTKKKATGGKNEHKKTGSQDLLPNVQEKKTIAEADVETVASSVEIETTVEKVVAIQPGEISRVETQSGEFSNKKMTDGRFTSQRQGYNASGELGHQRRHSGDCQAYQQWQQYEQWPAYLMYSEGHMHQMQHQQYNAGWYAEQPWYGRAEHLQRLQ